MSRYRDARYCNIAVLGADCKRYAMGAAALERITRHLELRGDGLTVRAIAGMTGWSYPTVWRDISQYRLVSRSADLPRETEAPA